MALEVDVVDIPDNMSQFYDLGVESLECRKADRQSRILSATIISAMGLLQIIEYADLYGDSVDYRNQVQDKLFACMNADHEYWKNNSFAHTVNTYEYVLNPTVIDDSLPEFRLSALDNSELTPARIASTIGLESSDCDWCTNECDNILAIESVGSELNALSSMARSNERIYESRVDLKVSALQGLERASRNYSAVGRAAMTQSLSIANTLTAIAANGLNTGLATLGNGLSSLIGNSDYGV